LSVGDQPRPCPRPRARRASPRRDRGAIGGGSVRETGVGVPTARPRPWVGPSPPLDREVVPPNSRVGGGMSHGVSEGSMRLGKARGGQRRARDLARVLCAQSTSGLDYGRSEEGIRPSASVPNVRKVGGLRPGPHGSPVSPIRRKPFSGPDLQPRSRGASARNVTLCLPFGAGEVDPCTSPGPHPGGNDRSVSGPFGPRHHPDCPPFVSRRD